MTGFEPRTAGIGSNHSTNWATQLLPAEIYYYLVCDSKLKQASNVTPLSNRLNLFIIHAQNFFGAFICFGHQKY